MIYKILNGLYRWWAGKFRDESLYCNCGACGDIYGCGCDKRCDSRLKCLYPYIPEELAKFSHIGGGA